MLQVVPSATAYRSGGAEACRCLWQKQAGEVLETSRSACATMMFAGDGMSNVDLLNTLLSVAGLVVSVISLTIALKR